MNLYEKYVFGVPDRGTFVYSAMLDVSHTVSREKAAEAQRAIKAVERAASAPFKTGVSHPAKAALVMWAIDLRHELDSTLRIANRKRFHRRVRAIVQKANAIVNRTIEHAQAENMARLLYERELSVWDKMLGASAAYGGPQAVEINFDEAVRFASRTVYTEVQSERQADGTYKHRFFPLEAHVKVEGGEAALLQLDEYERLLTGLIGEDE